MKIFTSNSLLLLLQNLKTKLDGKSDTSHIHDNRYYTESEVDTKLNNKSNTSHTHNYAGSSSAGGAATSAIKLTTARTIGLGTGVTSTATSFDGSGNITIPVNSVKESYLSWGGKNLAGDVTPIGSALSSEHSANRLAFIHGNALTMEYSSDGGSTWTDYGFSANGKSQFCTTSLNIPIGRASASTEYTTNSRTRITISAQGYVYTDPKKLLINISSSGGMQVLIEYKQGVGSASWQTFGTYALSGWSGWNDIPLVLGTLGGSSSQTSNIWFLRMTFIMTSINSSYKTTAQVNAIRLFGTNNWTSASERNSKGPMSSTGHLYYFDINANATFPAAVTATSFNGTATTATKLGTSTVGGTTTPIYLNNGTPTALGYTIAKSVPSDAKFTDTTYSVATSTKDGLMSAADKKLFDYTNNQLETDLDNLLDKPAESIADIIYPVGSIYMSVNSVNPGALFGGSWEQIAQGRTLFGAGKLNGIKYTAGEEIDAGLPNITGKWTTRWNVDARGFHGLKTEGAFYDSYPNGFNGSGRITSEDGNNGGTKGYPWFDASRSNPIYGNSKTVQPNALVVYIWKRTA